MQQENRTAVHFGSLAIPQRLLTAQNEGKLVVFAGAGVSTPSGLPNYNELCSNIEDCFREKRRQDEQYEDFFERLCDKHGLAVRQQVKKELKKNSPEPNQLHRDIIGLFEANKLVRIITTNFDPLFSLASNERQPNEPPDDWYYDGLPGGTDFKGLVYLHGCITRDLEKLVLTQTDFTKAYMSGHASTFLQGAFRENLVVFVGYSLEDPLVARLARILPRRDLVFSIVPENAVKRWQNIGVETITYSLEEGVERHTKFAEGLHKWSEYSKMDIDEQRKYLLGHGDDLTKVPPVSIYSEEEDRIKEIVSKSPPLEETQRKHIEDSLDNVPTTRFFTRHATKDVWLEWLDEREILKSLFDPECKLTDTESLLTDWICTRFVCSSPETVFGLVHKHGQQLNPEFWRRIVWQVTHAEERPEPKVLAKWVAILLRDVPTDAYRYHSLDYLLTKCRYPEDKGVMIQLLEYLLSPVVETETSFYISEKMKAEENKIDLRLRLRGDSYWLDECWQGVFKPKLDELWRTLAPIVQLHLTLAYTINESIGHAAGDHDRESWWRSAIESHEQDKHRRSFDALLDVARDVLKCALTNDPSAGDCLIAAWFSSGVPLLKRIAIHGVSIASHWMADEKINWVLENDLIYHHPYKHEVFQVIAKAFKDASGDVQHRLVERAEKGANLNV